MELKQEKLKQVEQATWFYKQWAVVEIPPDMPCSCKEREVLEEHVKNLPKPSGDRPDMKYAWNPSDDFKTFIPMYTYWKRGNRHSSTRGNIVLYFI